MKELINILLPSISVILSAIISYFISKTNAKNEIKRISMEFDRKDRDAFNSTFAKLMRYTTNYLNFPSKTNINNAVETNTLLLAIAPKEYLPLLQEMDRALNCQNKEYVFQIREQLITLSSTEK